MSGEGREPLADKAGESTLLSYIKGFPDDSSNKESSYNAGDTGNVVSIPAQPRRIPVQRILGGWLSPPSFGPSQILPVSFQVVVPSSSLGPPVVRQLTQVVIIMPGQGGRLQSTIIYTPGP